MYVEEAKSVSGDNPLSANPADWDTGPLCFLAKKYKEFFNEGKKMTKPSYNNWKRT